MNKRRLNNILGIVILFLYNPIESECKITSNANYSYLNNDLDQSDRNNDFTTAIITGLSVIFIAGFGDKTFFMNMIYASINPFWEAFFVSLTVSELMNLFSLFLGEIIPLFVSRDIIDWVAIVLFALFGFALIIQGCMMESVSLNEEVIAITANDKEGKDEEMGVVQPLLLQDKIQSIDNNNNNNTNTKENKAELGIFNSWWKYSLAFMVGELGDKSQIATIVITAKYNFNGVFIGTSLAMALLVITALVFGKSIAGLLTNKQISILSGCVFLSFAISYLLNKLCLNL